MSEQKKARVVVLPCGKLCDQVYCGECTLWEQSEEQTRSYGKPTGYCAHGGLKFANEYCYQGVRRSY